MGIKKFLHPLACIIIFLCAQNTQNDEGVIPSSLNKT